MHIGLAHQAANDVQVILQPFAIIHRKKCNGVFGRETVSIGEEIHVDIGKLGKGFPEVFNKTLKLMSIVFVAAVMFYLQPQ
jgi:hypothetical protein